MTSDLTDIVNQSPGISRRYWATQWSVMYQKNNKGLPQEQWWFIPLPKGNTGLCTIYTLQQASGDQLQQGGGDNNNLPIGYGKIDGGKQVSVDYICERTLFSRPFFGIYIYEIVTHNFMVTIFSWVSSSDCKSAIQYYILLE